MFSQAIDALSDEFHEEDLAAYTQAVQEVIISFDRGLVQNADIPFGLVRNSVLQHNKDVHSELYKLIGEIYLPESPGNRSFVVRDNVLLRVSRALHALSYSGGQLIERGIDAKLAFQQLKARLSVFRCFQ